MTDDTTTTTLAPLPPVRRQVIVNVSAESAFDAWTDQLGTWWPFDGHSVCGAGATAAFVDGRLVEIGPDGSKHLWGTVTVWEPGRHLAMTWHPGQDVSAATNVDVQFDALDDQRTLVTLTHSGWENRADSTDARDNYRTGWVGVFERYSHTIGTSTGTGTTAPASDHASSWLVLEHTAWTPDSGSVFADPRFGEHIAFLRHADERGWLVAAGNLPDSPGSGMTVLRVPNADLASAVMAAQDDDLSVARALFGVHVRPWNVALSAVD